LALARVVTTTSAAGWIGRVGITGTLARIIPATPTARRIIRIGIALASPLASPLAPALAPALALARIIPPAPLAGRVVGVGIAAALTAALPGPRLTAAPAIALLIIGVCIGQAGLRRPGTRFGALGQAIA